MRKKKSDKPKQQIRTVPLQVGELTTQKRELLSQLRSELLTHAQAVTALLFVPDPLADTTSAKERFARLSGYQKQQSGINKAYLQVMVQQVQQAAFEQERRYFARLFGRLRHVDSELPKAEQKERLYYYVPVDVQGHVTEADFTKLRAIAELEFAAARTLLREVLIERDEQDFTLIQRAILQEIHEQALRRHRQLSFKDTEKTFISIPLDYRMLPQTKEGANFLGDLSNHVQLLLDRQNTRYQFFLSLSAPTPRGERIKLPMTISASVLERLLKAEQADVNSLTLVLGHNQVSVRMAIAKPHTEPVAGDDYLVARDFGYVNTISLSVIRLDEELDREKLLEIKSFTKEQAKKFLTTHALPEGESQVIERKRFSGRNFLNKISEHCETIDTLRSWIDSAYNKLDALKQEIVAELGLPTDALLSAESTHSKTRKFFQLLTKINKWKARRRGVYAKIAGLKKSWFGYLSNQELALVKKYKATLVRENLSVKAIEVDDPKYKGRLFNKMLNNGAQGQYRRAASEKFMWYGVPELAVPSFWTSQACTVHALVDETVRKGERFNCPKCPQPRHADEHAADTIGLYLLLKPFVTNTLLAQARSSLL